MSAPELQQIPLKTEEGEKIKQTLLQEQHFLLDIDYAKIEQRVLSWFKDTVS